MRRKIPETEYRASRVCRILGNPTAYQIIKFLFKGSKTPTELSKEIGVGISTVSNALRDLRNIDLVRYEVKADKRVYWLKHATLIEIVSKLEELVKKIRIQKW